MKQLFIVAQALIVSLLFLVALFSPQFFVSNKVVAQNSTAGETEEQCIGRNLAEYMNDVLDGAGDLEHIRTLSPAFNLTSPVEPLIFDAMVANGARFGELDGFAGNTYTLNGGANGAYDYYSTGWKPKFQSAAPGTPVVFTEYGDFGTKDHRTGAGLDRALVIARMIIEFGQAHNDSSVIGVNYFNALHKDHGWTNQEFTFHNLTDTEMQMIISNRFGKAGLNSALFTGGGQFQQIITESHLPIFWTTEIIDSPGHLESVVNTANNSPASFNLVIRLCVGDSCGFEEPQVLINFLTDLNSQINRDVWVIIGPNEPATEHWAAQECSNLETFDPEVRSPCGQTEFPEFHSLRPYPGDPCSKTYFDQAQMCGNDMIINQTHEVVYEQAIPDSCELLDPVIVNPEDSVPPGVEGGPRPGYTVELRHEICDFIVESGADVTVDLSNAELPILGNTEDVKNVERDGGFSFQQKMNNYVSWYLNGATQRAEDEPIELSAVGLFSLINFSGPTKKLIPGLNPANNQVVIQKLERNDGSGGPLGQNELIDEHGLVGEARRLGSGGQRHNQIVQCENGGVLGQCYDSGQPKRISDRSDSSYVPFSNTEDALGKVIIAGGDGASFVPQGDLGQQTDLADLTDYVEAIGGAERIIVTFENDELRDDSLYFAHIHEDIEVANLLQRTYLPKSQDSHVESSLGPAVPPTVTNRCQVLPIRSNPGDDLLGELNDPRPEFAYEWDIEARIQYEGQFECEFVEGWNQAVYNACRLPKQSEETTLACTGWLACQGFNQQIVGQDDGCNGLNFLCETTNTIITPGGSPESCTAEAISPFKPCRKVTTTALKITTQSPRLDELWNRTVNGSMSFVRRFFPRIDKEEDSSIALPLHEIEDIPTETLVSYDAEAIPASLINIKEVSTRASAITAPGKDGRIYFPHIGGIHKYFLEEIQCALRPQGAGCELPNQLIDTKTSCEINCVQDIPDTLIPNKYLGAFKESYIDLATRWTAGSGDNHAEACYNDVVRRSLEAGVNPAFTLMIWVNESGASNYNSHVTSCITQDFGINNTSIAANFDAQITRFLQLPFSYPAGWPECFDNGFTDIENWFHMFKSGASYTDGACIPDSDSIAYHTGMLTKWTWVAPGCGFPIYPTDMSCP